MAYTIEHDIPPPPEAEYEKPSRTNASTYPFTDMLVGDSFLVHVGDPKQLTVRHAASVAGRRWGKVFVTRVLNVGTRVWRTA